MPPILRLVVQRIALGIGLLLAVSALIFAGTQILPGDVAQSILGQDSTPQALANLRKELGLNDPAWIRYFRWLGALLTGDLGTALSSGQKISTQLSVRFSNTMFLAFWAALISVPLAIGLGLLGVRYREGPIDNMISAIALACTSVPQFFIGYLLIYFVAVKMQWLPSLSTVYEGMPFLARLKSTALPALTLVVVVFAHMMRMTRAAILNVMQLTYIETAKLKGLTQFEIIRRHALPNAIAPIVTVVMLNLAYLVVAVVVVEVIFVYPGMGQYMVDHVAKRDVPVVQVCGLIFAAVYIGLNIVADVVSIVANPRLRYPK